MVTEKTMSEFREEFSELFGGDMDSSKQPVYAGPDESITRFIEEVKCTPMEGQRNTIQSLTQLLFQHNRPAAIINGEMGTGKTLMSIAIAHCMRRMKEGNRVLVVVPPHLIYKWRREIMKFLPDVKVFILNGQDIVSRLHAARVMPVEKDQLHFYLIGKVRMRMGFNWVPAFLSRKLRLKDEHGQVSKYPQEFGCCADCGAPWKDDKGFYPNLTFFKMHSSDNRLKCGECGSPLWTLKHKKQSASDNSRLGRLTTALQKLPTVGPKRAKSLVGDFGLDLVEDLLTNNPLGFTQLMDSNSELVFSDKAAKSIERSLVTQEFSFGSNATYSPTEFIKRYLPRNFFDMLIADECHDYKGMSAQGANLGRLVSSSRKCLALTGTLMGGYGTDLFALLMRLFPTFMKQEGFEYKNGKLFTAQGLFMRSFGVLKDIYTYRETKGVDYSASNARKVTHNTSCAPGFSPAGIMRFLLPHTAFLSLEDLDENVLPPYTEHFVEVEMAPDQKDYHDDLSLKLTRELRKALRKNDRTLLGVVINVLLAWPDCCFREERVTHPHNRKLLVASAPAIVPAIPETVDHLLPKEIKLIEMLSAEKEAGRKSLVYTVYTQKRDTTQRLKTILEQANFRVAVLKSTVTADKREMWIEEALDKGIDVLICNPKLVEVGLDLLEFPTIIYMQSGYSTYTLWQASRRSWRIGQTKPVHVYFLGYKETAQISCLSLMSEKISVAQSVSGQTPETGLSVLNSSSESIEMAMAREILQRAEQNDPFGTQSARRNYNRRYKNRG